MVSASVRVSIKETMASSASPKKQDGLSRRRVLKLGAAAATMIAAPTAFVGPAGAQVGPLGPPNANGLRLPPGYTSRIVAQTGQKVGNTNYTWPADPDGGACFKTRFNPGWVYVANSEVRTPSGIGGVSLIRFNAAGAIVGARRILGGSTANCAGGATPWGSWLSCEEVGNGRVFETFPLSNRPAVFRPALGRFQHEAVAVDPVRRLLFLTEDRSDGAFYAFRPATWGNLSAGSLFVLTFTASGRLWWRKVPDPGGNTVPTRNQLPRTMRFNGGEGIVYANNSVYFATKGDNRIWRYRHNPPQLNVMYDDNTAMGPPNAIATGVDNLTANQAGSIFVAEDGGDMQIVLVKPGTKTFPIVQVVNTPDSELTGVAFNPAGNRMYFSSQRNPGRTYEVTGPFANL